MRLSRFLFTALIGCALVMSVAAQNQNQAKPPAGRPQSAEPLPNASPNNASPNNDSPNEAPTAAPPSRMRGWIPDGVAVLGQNAASRTEFTLDHALLVLASKLDKNNEDLQKVIAGVNGVSVRSFLDTMAMASISQQFREAGWQHLVSKHKNAAGETTDLWLRIDQASIRDVAVLLVKAREVDFILASGSVTPLDLLHLSGHFGIPKMDGGMAVPVPRH
jgi:hypothetical protein